MKALGIVAVILSVACGSAPVTKAPVASNPNNGVTPDTECLNCWTLHFYATSFPLQNGFSLESEVANIGNANVVTGIPAAPGQQWLGVWIAAQNLAPSEACMDAAGAFQFTIGGTAYASSNPAANDPNASLVFGLHNCIPAENWSYGQVYFQVPATLTPSDVAGGSMTHGGDAVMTAPALCPAGTSANTCLICDSAENQAGILSHFCTEGGHW